MPPLVPASAPQDLLAHSVRCCAPRGHRAAPTAPARMGVSATPPAPAPASAPMDGWGTSAPYRAPPGASAPAARGSAAATTGVAVIPWGGSASVRPASPESSAGRGARWGGTGRTARRAVTVPTGDSASTWMVRACARPAFRAAAARSPAAFPASTASSVRAAASVTPSTARAATRCSASAHVVPAGPGSSATRAAPPAPSGLAACSSASASTGAPAMGPPGAATALLVTRMSTAPPCAPRTPLG